MSLLINEPLVIAHKTGSSREETKPVAFSALTARSSPNIPAVFFVAILLAKATSSINIAISSKIAKIPDAICLLKLRLQNYSGISNPFTKESFNFNLQKCIKQGEIIKFFLLSCF